MAVVITVTSAEQQAPEPSASPSTASPAKSSSPQPTAAINRVEELLAQYGLVLKAFSVLAVVSGVEEPLPPTAITGRTIVVTSVLDALERRQLVRRCPYPASCRSVLVEATL